MRALAELVSSSTSGFWGQEPGRGEVNARVIRNGDVLTTGDVDWRALPLRSVSQTELTRAGVRRGDIVITTSGNCGYVAYVSETPSEPTIASNFIRVLRFVPEVLPRYAYNFMHRGGFRTTLLPYIRGTTMKNLALADALRHIRMPVPPRDTQRQIAASLDDLRGLRRSRERALESLTEYPRALFNEMFGAGGWPEFSVAALVDGPAGGIRTGPFGSDLLHSEFVPEGIAVLGIDNVVMNEFRWGQRRYITPEKYERLKRYTIHPGDVLITIMGTNGRCAVVPDDIPLAINTKHLCCITLDQTLCRPRYLHAYFLYSAAAQRYLGQRAKGAIMAGLNMTIIKGMPVLLPPVDKQRAFEERVLAFESLRRAMTASLAGLDELIAVTEYNAFRDEAAPMALADA